MTYDVLKLKNQLCHPLYSSTNALMRVYKPLLERIDLTYPQYLIMLALWEQDQINIKDICAATHFDSGTVTPLLQKLKKKNLISIKSDSSDKRNKIISLTSKGQKLQSKATQVPEQLICLFNFTLEEAKLLKKLTEKLRENLVKVEENISHSYTKSV
jgi:MarR family transcriptional regulator, organic hydroperoxide resistance regulator